MTKSTNVNKVCAPSTKLHSGWNNSILKIEHDPGRIANLVNQGGEIGRKEFDFLKVSDATARTGKMVAVRNVVEGLM